MESRNERERLKQVYKSHYHRIRDMKKRVRQLEYQKSTGKAISAMNRTDIFSEMDASLQKVNRKVAEMEARLEIVLSDQFDNDLDTEQIQQFERNLEEERLRHKSRETIRKWKNEMGRLQDEIDSEAERLEKIKSMGNQNRHTRRISGEKTGSSQDHDVSGGTES